MADHTVLASTVITQLQIDLRDAIELAEEMLSAITDVMQGSDYAEQREWPDRLHHLKEADTYYQAVTHGGRLEPDRPVVVSDPAIVVPPGSEPCR